MKFLILGIKTRIISRNEISNKNEDVFQEIIKDVKQEYIYFIQ